MGEVAVKAVLTVLFRKGDKIGLSTAFIITTLVSIVMLSLVSCICLHCCNAMAFENESKNEDLDLGSV